MRRVRIKSGNSRRATVQVHSNGKVSSGYIKTDFNITRRDAILTTSVGLCIPPVLVFCKSASATSINQVAPKSQKLGFEDRVSEFTLSNGLHFIVLERHEAPVLSCMVHANVGAYDEDDGSTGMAHLLEHMAFKGTSSFGTRDWNQEGPMLDALDEVFYELRQAKERVQQTGGSASALAQISLLENKLQTMQAAASQLSIPNAFGALLQQEGGVGLNATTSQDNTKYFVSLPSNKLELWFALESDRFKDPVFRDLYSEKKVIEQERRLRIDSSPMGKYQQQFALKALGNNYRRPVIGFSEDVDRMGRKEVFSFFKKHYGPKNLTIVIVGDTSVDQVHRLAQQYFGDWNPQGYVTLPSGPQLASLSKAEPLPLPLPQSGKIVDTVSKKLYQEASEAGPLCMLGFYRPALSCHDGLVLQVLFDILIAGRTSRLVSKLVMRDNSLLMASGTVSFTGEKHAGLSILFARPANGSTPAIADRLIRGELDRFMNVGPTEQELRRVKKATEASLYGVLQSNSGMADVLATYHVLTGSWRGVLEEISEVQGLNLAECTRVSQTLLLDRNCFRGYVDRLSSQVTKYA